jgi:CheY-like chemotaxis protein
MHTAPHLPPRVAIVAENDPLTRAVIARVLTRLGGYHVTEAADGAAALAAGRRLAAAELRPTLLVTDLDMRELDGVALAAALAPIVPGLRVLIASGHPLPRRAAAALAAVPHAYLPKPFGAGALLNALGALGA